jgi:diacylglycerol kinase (ATP)
MKVHSESNTNSTPYKRKGLIRLVRAFGFSLEGLGSTLKHEAAFRQEAILAALLIPLSFWLPVSPVEQTLLIGSVLLILIVELLNSGLEAAVDDISLEKRALAKRAKDMGSAAVLMSLLNAALCWTIIVASHWKGILNQFS